MRIAQLRELCEEKGLDCVGLKKANMLALLKQTDANEAMASAAADNGKAGSDDEVTVDGAAGDSSGDNANVGSAHDREAVTALKLKLLLAKEERLMQKERAEMKEVEWERRRESRCWARLAVVHNLMLTAMEGAIADSYSTYKMTS